MTKSIPQAKNAIARAFRAILDAPLSKAQKDAIWGHFGERCCYCDKLLSRVNREGHIDHLDSASDLGANDLSNLVLSCCNCNGDEKLDKHWLEFLTLKCSGDSDAFERRKNKVDDWVALHARGTRSLSAEQKAEVDAAIDRVHTLVSREAERLRLMRGVTERHSD